MTVSGAVRSERAHAKINLFLHVVGRRDDGYHLLDSLVTFAGAHDVLFAVATPDPVVVLTLTGRYGDALRGEAAVDNLVARAAWLLQRELGASGGAALRLDKRLPVASGIGGALARGRP